MKQLFGNSFISIYGSEPSTLWRSAISELTDEEVEIGLLNLSKEKRAFPANLTEFVAACKPTAGSPRFLGVPIDPKTLRIRHKPTREHVDACLERMRRRVNLGTEKT